MENRNCKKVEISLFPTAQRWLLLKHFFFISSISLIYMFKKNRIGVILHAPVLYTTFKTQCIMDTLPWHQINLKIYENEYLLFNFPYKAVHYFRNEKICLKSLTMLKYFFERGALLYPVGIVSCILHLVQANWRGIIPQQ